MEDVFNNQALKYSDSPSGTIDVGPAFNLPTLISKQGGKGIDNSLLSKVTLDGKGYNEAAT